MLRRFINFPFRRPTVNILTFDDDDDDPLRMDNLIPVHSCKKSIRGIFSHKLCQEDQLDLRDDTNPLESMDEGTNIGKSEFDQDESPEPRKKSSFERLLELMLNRNVDKGVQAPEQPIAPPQISVSKIHQLLDQQLHTLNDLIQRKILSTIHILHHPIASQKIDNVLERDPVGYTDALCFIANLAVRKITKEIAEGRVSLGKSDVEVLRKKFFSLTSTIEATRKTRVKVFSQFNKQIAIPLETMVGTNAVVDDDRLTVNFYVPTVPRQKHINQQFDDNSFESIFWANYSSIMKQLVSDSKVHQPTKSDENTNTLQVTWDMWKRNFINCGSSNSSQIFEYSSADVQTQLQILGSLLDVACSNFKTAQLCLKTAENDFREGKKIFREFADKIRISTLNAEEVAEILKVIQAAAATAITFLKSIEKSTRTSRLFISEAIYQFRSALGQTKDKKNREFTHKPIYIALSFALQTNLGTSPQPDRVKEPVITNRKSIIPLFRNAETSRLKSKPDKGGNSDQDLIRRSYSDTAISYTETGMDLEVTTKATQSEQAITTIVAAKEALDNREYLSPKPKSTTATFQVRDADFLQMAMEKEMLNLEIMVIDRLQQAHAILNIPSVTAWEGDGKVPFVLGFCSILVEMILQLRPYREIPRQNQQSILRKMKAFNESTNFGNEKKDFVRTLAVELSQTSELLLGLGRQLMVDPEDIKSETSTNQNLCADARSLASTVRLQSGGKMWEIRWNDRREGILLRYAADTLRTTNFASLKLPVKCELVFSMFQFVTRLYNEAGAHMAGAEKDLQTANRILRAQQRKLQNYMKNHSSTAEDLQYFGMRLGKVRASHAAAVELLGRINSALSQVASIMFVLNVYLGAQNHLEQLRMSSVGIRDKKKEWELISTRLSQAEEFLKNIYSVPLAMEVPLQIKLKRLPL